MLDFETVISAGTNDHRPVRAIHPIDASHRERFTLDVLCGHVAKEAASAQPPCISRVIHSPEWQR